MIGKVWSAPLPHSALSQQIGGDDGFGDLVDVMVMLTMMLLFAMVMMILVVTMVMMTMMLLMMVMMMMMMMMMDIISLLLSLRGHLHNRRSSLFHLDLDLDLVSYNL